MNEAVRKYQTSVSVSYFVQRILDAVPGAKKTFDWGDNPDESRIVIAELPNENVARIFWAGASAADDVLFCFELRKKSGSPILLKRFVYADELEDFTDLAIDYMNGKLDLFALHEREADRKKTEN